MRWVMFAILLYLIIVLQTAVAPFLAVMHVVRPDFPLLFAVYFALAAPVPDALLAACITGLAVDLSGASFAASSNIGVNALAYGFAALAIVKLRHLLFRDHAVTYLFFVLTGGFLIHLAGGLFMLYRTGQFERAPDAVQIAIYTAIYTALISPYAHWLLRRSRGVLGFGPMQTLRVR